MHGVVDSLTTRYGLEYTVMSEMHWSYPDLCAAPNDMVEEIATRIHADNEWRREKDKQDKGKAEANKSANRNRGKR